MHCGWSLSARVHRLAELACQLPIDLAGIAIHSSRNLRREQRRNDSIFISGPNSAIETQERCTRAFFSPKTERAVEQAVHEPLEADRNLIELAVQFSCDAIDHLTADHRLTHGRCMAPFRPVLKKIVDSSRQVVIGLEQTRIPRDDSMPIMVRVTGKRDVEAIFQSDQIRHGVRRGWVHADLAVPIHTHETESRIDEFVHDGEIELVLLSNSRPVMNARAAKRIYAHVYLRAAN